MNAKRRRWKRSDVTTRMLTHTHLIVGLQAWEFLTDVIGIPPKVVRAAILRDVERERLNYGVCPERYWVEKQ